MRPSRPTLYASGALLALVLLSAPAAVRAEEAENEVMLASKGRTSFNLFCRSCHGEEGAGDGTVAEFLKVPPADLTTINARNDGEFPFDKIYKAIDGREVRAHGSDMPLWGNAFQETEETTDELVVKEKIIELVYFLKSIQKKAAKAE